MKKLFYLIIMVCAICACSDSDDGGAFPLDSFELKPIPDKETVFRTYPSDAKKYLGAGYDVTVDYLSPEGVRASVIDWDKVSERDLERMELMSSEPRNYVGESAESLLTRITEVFAMTSFSDEEDYAAPWFAGTFLGDDLFRSDYDHSTQYSFACCEQLVSMERLFLTGILNEYLSSSFLDDVQNCSPKEIIEKYGTHVMKDICLGARYRGMFKTLLPTVTSKGDMERTTLVSALVKMNRLGIFTGLVVGGADELASLSVGSQLVMEFYGGDASLVNSHSSSLAPWLQSVNEDNYALTDWTRYPTPIYELIDNPAKRAQVKEAIKQYVADSKMPFTPTAMLLQAWNGKNHTYHNSYPDQHFGYEGPVCSLYRRETGNTVPLYLYSNGERNYLTLDNPDEMQGGKWEFEKVIGFVYASQEEGTVPLYETRSQHDYCYTTEDRESYGVLGSWKKERVVCYVRPL